MSGGMEDTAYMSGVDKKGGISGDTWYRSGPTPFLQVASIAEEVKYRKQLIEDHWKYVEGILSHYKSDVEISEIGFHYKTAMEHGWKHAMEYIKEGYK